MDRYSIIVTDEGKLAVATEKVTTCDWCGEPPEDGEELTTTADYEGGDECNIVCLACDEDD